MQMIAAIDITPRTIVIKIILGKIVIKVTSGIIVIQNT